MKVLMVHPHDLISPFEPWTIRILKLAEELADRGHEVEIAYFPFGKCKINTFRGIRIIPLERTISTGALRRNTGRLRSFLREADIIHFQKSHFYSAIPAILASYLTGKPFHYDWDDWEEKIFNTSVYRRTLTTFLTGFSFLLMEWCLPFLADSVSVASEALKKMALQRGASKKKVFSVPVGADLKQFRPDRSPGEVREKYDINGALLVLYHGQLHSCQYVGLFLEAIRFIFLLDVQRCDRLKFMVMGSGSELEALKNYAKTLCIEGRVIFTDSVPHEDVPEYLAAADICVAPFENNKVTRCKSPLKIVEYLASGKPIVASDVGEVRDMVEGAGLLVEPGKSEALARGILELADNEALRKTIGIAARQRAETKYNWRRSAENLEKAYEVALRIRR